MPKAKKKVKLSDNYELTQKLVKVEPACVGMSSFDLEKRIITLEQRIDRIVAAIGKAKSVKGL